MGRRCWLLLQAARDTHNGVGRVVDVEQPRAQALGQYVIHEAVRLRPDAAKGQKDGQWRAKAEEVGNLRAVE